MILRTARAMVITVQKAEVVTCSAWLLLWALEHSDFQVVKGTCQAPGCSEEHLLMHFSIWVNQMSLWGLEAVAALHKVASTLFLSVTRTNLIVWIVHRCCLLYFPSSSLASDLQKPNWINLQISLRFWYTSHFIVSFSFLTLETSNKIKSFT